LKPVGSSKKDNFQTDCTRKHHRILAVARSNGIN
jgi:hypothetical protein